MNRQQLGRYLRNGVVIVALGAALVACSSGGGTSVSTTPPAAAPPPKEDFFGTGFGVQFRAAANSEPVVPKASDIIAVSLTTEPQAI